MKKAKDERLKAIAKRLAFFRNKSGLSQTKVAQLLGITVVQYCRWESGNFDFSVSKLLKLADFYKIPLLELFTDNIFTEAGDFAKIADENQLNFLKELETAKSKT